MTASDSRAFVDDLDRSIVRALASDGRMSYTDLGKLTGLSTSAVHHRVRRLEERGVLRGYRAVVDPALLGLPLTAFISLTPLDQAAPDDVPDRLRDLVEVEAIHAVAGEANYMIKVRVDAPSKLENLLPTIRQKASVARGGVRGVSRPSGEAPDPAECHPPGEEARWTQDRLGPRARPQAGDTCSLGSRSSTGVSRRSGWSAPCES
jgi:Lrp/AsnC family transcriptional regulator, leucine-responsive regulatory protein